MPGTRSVYAERVAQGYFADIRIDRDAIARYGLHVQDVQDVIQSAIGGENITRTIEGRERYPVNVRYQRDFRESLPDLERVLVKTPMGEQVPLGQLAEITLTPGPAMIRDENAQLAGYVYIDTATRDIGGYVDRAKRVVDQQVTLPAGYTLQWTGQYEFQVRARERLKVLLPIVFFVIFMLLYLTFHSVGRGHDRHAVGGLRDDRRRDPAVAARLQLLGGRVGRLHRALRRRRADRRRDGRVPARGARSTAEAGRRDHRGGHPRGDDRGSVLRLRPKLMTVSVVMAGLLPILWSTGVGSDVMKPIAAPIVGGMVTSTIHVLIITPVIFYIMKLRALRKGTLKPSRMTR